MPPALVQLLLETTTYRVEMTALAPILHDDLQQEHADFFDAGRVPGATSEVLGENGRLKRENAELRKANEVLKAESVFFAKELARPSTR